jgi:hypothetical protein
LILLAILLRPERSQKKDEQEIARLLGSLSRDRLEVLDALIFGLVDALPKSLISLNEVIDSSSRDTSAKR